MMSPRSAIVCLVSSVICTSSFVRKVLIEELGELPGHGGGRGREPHDLSGQLLTGHGTVDTETRGIDGGREIGVLDRGIEGTAQQCQALRRQAGRRNVGPGE